MDRFTASRWWFPLVSLALLSPGCEKAPPPEEAPTQAVAAVTESGGSEAAEPREERTHPGLAPGAGMPTVAGNGMPNDAVHAGLPRGHNRGAPVAAAGLPQGHPPLPGHPAMGQRRPRRPMASPPEPTPMEEGVALPLPLKGPGGAAELAARLGSLPDGEAGADVRRRIEQAFRLTFTGDRSKRDVRKAAELLAPIASAPEAAATSERILGYVAVSSGFDVPRAFKHYGRAVELEPEYGEAHYALAFMHAMKDRTSGKKHYDKALSLGVPDTRGLSRFYGQPGKQAPTPGH